MTPSEPITQWVERLKSADPLAAQKLWEHYFEKLAGLARARLRNAAGRMADEEDVALSAFNSFFCGAAAGRFPQLNDRHELWKLLVVLTLRKAADLLEREQAVKRGGTGGHPDRTMALAPAGAGIELDLIAGSEPTPEMAAELFEQCQVLLGRLSEELRQVAIWRMEGYTVEEIAERLGCAPRSVERKLRVIRSLWDPEGEKAT